MKFQKWNIGAPDEQDIALLRGAGYPYLLSVVLAARGVHSPEAAAEALDRERSLTLSPMGMKDMDKAVARIQRAIADGETIAVFGDYDVDGITSTVLLMDYLKSCGVKCLRYIPRRVEDGYGLSCEAIRGLRDQGATLMVTVDCGITGNEEVAYAASLGMDVVVTDHHECKEQLPAAVAVVDPHRPDCPYPFKHLAGVGVALKLVLALGGQNREDALFARYCTLAAIGTVADVMRMEGENRTIVSCGLEALPHTDFVGIHALLKEAGLLGKPITSIQIGFVLSPRINAAGRMGQAELAAELFLTRDPVRAQMLAAELCEQNKRRQNEENQILTQALARLRMEYNPLEDKIIVLAGEGWHHGVIGIVCSRLCDRYGCPVVLIALDEDGTGKGSGRSVKGFNLFEALTSCGDLLQRYGGHELAAGLTVDAAHIEALRERLRAYAENHVSMADLIPQLHIDCMIEPEWITLENIQALSVLEPYGMQNEEPVFCMKDLTVEEITPISSDRHVRLTLVKDGKRWSAMLFGTGVGGLGFAQGNMVDAAFHLEINEFRGRRSVQLTLCDVRLSECENLADQSCSTCITPTWRMAR